ncbi:uncharacterized protein LOC143079189 isoform X2 [Mytilus galloprovincialis]|uniref:uncharacterized protein LOC143079189 isoform X2 n=1 Tax=Mytilus galloprovincialis TaxID=29158 RepID=UPI003F7C9344
MSDQGNLKKSEKEKSKKKKVETPTNKADRKPDTTAQSELEKEVETPTNKAEGNLDKSQKPKNLYVGESDSYQFNSQVNKQTGHGEDEHSVNNDSEKQNSSHQTSGILDVETVKRIVKEELSKDKRSIKMQTGAIMSLTAFFLGTMTSYWWTPHYTNTTIVVGDNTTQSSIVMEDVTQTLLQCQANLTQIKGDFKNVQDNFVYLKNEVTEVNNGITGTIEGVKGKLKEDVLLLKRDIKILNGKHQIHDNKYITYSETVFLLLVGLILWTLILFLIAYKFFPWRNGFYGSQGSKHDDPNDTNESLCAQVPVQHMIKQKRWTILDQIDIPSELEESVCILSFHEATQDLHHRIITSVFQEEEVEIKPFLLEKTDPDVLDIPRCQFVFVFVDFNETNVILENPGDKRLVTVEACMKMRADVFVIYTRDRDSSHLGDGTLYNKDLSAFTGHFLLKELTAEKRGLSVNDTFTQYQRSHIRKIVLEK